MAINMDNIPALRSHAERARIFYMAAENSAVALAYSTGGKSLSRLGADKLLEMAREEDRLAKIEARPHRLRNRQYGRIRFVGH